MSTFPVLMIVSAVTLLFLFRLVRKHKRDSSKSYPKGSMGFLPVIGESLSFVNAHKANRGQEWVEERVAKYGPIFKTSLMGGPTVFITGRAGTKFVLGAETEVLAPRQPFTIAAIMGKHNLFEVSGTKRYKPLRRAMMSFLKPDILQGHTKLMDNMVKARIDNETKGKDTITTISFMKKLTFHVASQILFGIADDSTEEALYKEFGYCFEAMWSAPFNFPGTTFRKGIQARKRIVNTMLPIMEKRKEQIKKGTLNPMNDVLSCMLSLETEAAENGDHEEPITMNEVIDNFVALMIASHDSSAAVLTWVIWKLAKDREIYDNVVREQMSIIEERKQRQEGGGEADGLIWGDVSKMKYTWRVVQEVVRVIPPFFGSFRTAIKDTSYGGYDIPKGWQVFWVAFSTHMNNDIFNDPAKFDPSRFDSKSNIIPPYSYLAFGAGHHICIGLEFARVEALVVLHHMVTKFEWSLVNSDEKLTRLALPYPEMGLPINLISRSSC
ncbi:hypothetical protein C5167_023839 [Papaver somniferum]|uniref:Cytochrome P450 n=1 Tax=Papaver somniferum TaxID=3469 RepID=A0A4Y7JMU7_PAPSO|nr:taxane 13-alpha-hydroxylase-like isoform X1 [Papaver somniferum]RZC62067.1 hypothetical protein C5167_023839 [Papaver somniferum]